MDAFVAEHLAGVSRTYAILIPMLPRGLADPVGLAYLLMRIVDTLEDATELSSEQRLHLFEQLEAALRDDHATIPDELIRPIGDNSAEHALMEQVPAVFERIDRLELVYREAVRTCARKMMAGVREFIARSNVRSQPYPAIHDAAELRSYCYYVAGVVGEMLCDMMAHYLDRPSLRNLNDLAVELGIGLQLVNVLKDCLKDAGQGRRYLPTPSGDDAVHADIYTAVLQEARLSLQRGTEFVLALPAEAVALRSFCGLPIAWGALTLTRAESDASQAKISRGAISSTINRFAQLAGDDQGLRQWFDEMLHPPQVEETV